MCACVMPDGNVKINNFDEPSNTTFSLPSNNFSNLPMRRFLNFCRVDVYPDGRILFADGMYGAEDWLSLDSISFPIQQQGAINDSNPEAVALINIEKTPYQRSDQISVGQMSNQSNRYYYVSGILNDVKCEAFLLQGQRSKFDHFDMPNLASFTDDCFSATSAFYVKEDCIIHLFGSVVKDYERCDLKTKITGCPIRLMEKILILPENLRPESVHDFAVVVDEGDDDGLKQIAIARIHPDGVLTITDLGSCSRGFAVLRVHLDGIRYATNSESSLQIQLSLGPAVLDFPVVEDFHNITKPYADHSFNVMGFGGSNNPFAPNSTTTQKSEFLFFGGAKVIVQGSRCFLSGMVSSVYFYYINNIN